VFGVDIKKFPPFIKMGSIAGKVSEKAAALYGSLGLKSGTPIASGAPDFISALIGTGVLKAGDVCDRAGSSEGINFCARSSENAELKNLRVLPHVKEGFCNIGSLIPVSGRLFDMYKSCTNQESRPYESLLAELIPQEFDKRLFQPDLFFPLQSDSDFAPPSGVQSGDTTAFGRSVLCAIGFSVRRAVETLESRGFPVKAMRVSGGQGKNPLWNQLKADISGVSLLVPEICDGELAGNAVLAACALENRPGGDFEQVLEAACGRMIRFREEYSPRAETAPFWEERYKAQAEGQRQAG
jgi:xylulokinase